MPDTTQTPARSLPEATATIVMAYASSHHFPSADLTGLIAAVHGALAGLGRPAAPGAERPGHTPAEIRKSITPDHLVSFEDGQPYKSLKRHLRGYGLTPETYRAKHGLPVDYPMVCASYSEARSAIAKSFRLGQRREAA